MRLRSLLAPLILMSVFAVDAGAQDKKHTARTEFEGKSGPYIEAIEKGEAAFLARDFAGAVSAFQDAVKKQSDSMIGFYRLGEAQRATGKLDEAEATWQTAVGKKGADDLKAKLLFVLADLKERQEKWQAAKDAWSAYLNFLQSNPKARGYPNSATERQKQCDRRMKDEKDYGAVKDRIAKREAEKIKEAEENAKKDKLNK